MGIVANDHNIAAAYTDCFMKFSEHHETRLGELIDTLKSTNVEIEIIRDVMNKIAHAQEEDPEKIDFNDDEMMKRCIVHIHKNNPTIFGDYIEGFIDSNGSQEASAAFIGDKNARLDESLKGIDMSKIRINIATRGRSDAVVSGLDGQIQMHANAAHETTATITSEYDIRGKTMESARLAIKQTADLLESINRKSAAR